MDVRNLVKGKPVLYYLTLAIMIVGFFGVASQAHAQDQVPQVQCVCDQLNVLR